MCTLSRSFAHIQDNRFSVTFKRIRGFLCAHKCCCGFVGFCYLSKHILLFSFLPQWQGEKERNWLTRKTATIANRGRMNYKGIQEMGKFNIWFAHFAARRNSNKPPPTYSISINPWLYYRHIAFFRLNNCSCNKFLFLKQHFPTQKFEPVNKKKKEEPGGRVWSWL